MYLYQHGMYLEEENCGIRSAMLWKTFFFPVLVDLQQIPSEPVGGLYS